VGEIVEGKRSKEKKVVFVVSNNGQGSNMGKYAKQAKRGPIIYILCKQDGEYIVHFLIIFSYM
jgi:hypothetical protein